MQRYDQTQRPRTLVARDCRMKVSVEHVPSPRPCCRSAPERRTQRSPRSSWRPSRRSDGRISCSRRISMAENGDGHALQCHLALSRNRPVFHLGAGLGMRGAVGLDAQTRSTWQASGLCSGRRPSPLARRSGRPHLGGVRAARRAVAADWERKGRGSGQHSTIRGEHLQIREPVAAVGRVRLTFLPLRQPRGGLGASHLANSLAMA